MPTPLPITGRPSRLAVVGLGQISELVLPTYARDDVLVPTPAHGSVVAQVLDAARTGATLRVLEDPLFYPPLVQLHDVLQSGELGAPRHLLPLRLLHVRRTRGGNCGTIPKDRRALITPSPTLRPTRSRPPPKTWWTHSPDATSRR